MLVGRTRDAHTSGQTRRQYVIESWTSPIYEPFYKDYPGVYINRSDQPTHKDVLIEGPARAHFPLYASLAQGRILGHAMYCCIRAELPMPGSSSQFRRNLGLELLMFMLWLLWRV